MKVGLTAVKIGITGFILPFAFALNPDYIVFNWDFQTLLTWISGIVVELRAGGYVPGVCGRQDYDLREGLAIWQQSVWRSRLGYCRP